MNPYDITPNINPDQYPNKNREEKMKRDQIKFPDALPCNSHQPFHSMDYTFVDRQFQNDRRKNDLYPVQNDYLQKYQIHELQQQNYGYNTMEQNQIDRIMDKKAPTDGNLLDRNRDDALFFGRQNPVIMPNFMPTPLDTRKEKIDLNKDRELMPKVLGAPPKYNQYRKL